MADSSRNARRTRRGLLAVGVAGAAAAAGIVWLAGQPQPVELTCAQVDHLADAYVAKRLSQTRRDQVDRHRRMCARCDARLRQIPSAAAV